MFRSRSWFGGSLWRNKNPHSLDHLKYLYNVLSKNQTVSENNRGLLVETLRSIAEILIWGDQNDSSVFDFFLEKNMLSFFLKILKQKCGSYVCVQILQTLNILFENIRNETSLYYLLSNNHVNSIIVHKFDFSDEEVMAYYISFLKTLSLKLNSHTIHFFYNDVSHTNDFPLYTEAIKFFKHPESMVRIAVRTLTLNVYRVQDHSMLRFIRNKTAAPYFSNLVWFIGNHVLELDSCVRNEADHLSQTRLADLVAEHLDHLHYLNDILCLEIEELNDVLVDHLLNKLFIPLYTFSLLPSSPDVPSSQENKSKISCVVALFLLSQVFLITAYKPLVQVLAEVILLGTSVINGKTSIPIQSTPSFVPPPKTLEEFLESRLGSNSLDSKHEDLPNSITNLNITDEEKEQILAQESANIILEIIVNNLECAENDYVALFALCLLYAISCNSGIERTLLDGVLLPSDKPDPQPKYNTWIVQKLINIITSSCQPVCKIRLVTLELAIVLLLRLVYIEEKSYLSDAHLAALVSAKEESTSLLRKYYKRKRYSTELTFTKIFDLPREEIFWKMFENEDEELRKKPLNAEWLMMDSNVLLPPTGTPMTGISFEKRLPCGEAEKARKAIRAFLLVRSLCQTLSSEKETELPLSNRNELVANQTILDLNNSDLLSCYVIGPDGVKNHRFLATEGNQILLVVPVPEQLGYGRSMLAGMLQDMELSGDKQDCRSLYVSMKHTTAGNLSNVRFIFDDSIRCMAAQQRLSKGIQKAKEEKMRQIEKLLDIPVTDSPQCNLLHQLRHHNRALYGRPAFSHRIPGYVTPIRMPPMSSPKSSSTDENSRRDSGGSSSGSRSRDCSPKMPRPRSEEIQLENMFSKRGSLKGGGDSIPENECLKISKKQGVSSEGRSRETSFTETSSVTEPSKKKGKVETI